jgi:hypothetical protein
MLIYVASKFENSKSVREAHAALREDGHTITHDWTSENATGKTGEELEYYLEDCARKDLHGVIEANGMLLLNHQLMAGGFSEFGMALMKRAIFGDGSILIVVIDGRHPEKPRNIFFHLSSFVHHARDLAHAREIFKAHDVLKGAT